MKVSLSSVPSRSFDSFPLTEKKTRSPKAFAPSGPAFPLERGADPYDLLDRLRRLPYLEPNECADYFFISESPSAFPPMK